jgi:hypothetical protein
MNLPTVPIEQLVELFIQNKQLLFLKEFIVKDFDSSL